MSGGVGLEGQSRRARGRRGRRLAGWQARQ